MLILGSCSERQAILKEIKLVEKQTGDKNSDQSQLLLKIGKYALSYPQDVEIQFEYISDLYKAGYISSAMNSALRFYKQFPNHPEFRELYLDCQLKLCILPGKDFYFSQSDLLNKNKNKDEAYSIIRGIQSLDSSILRSQFKSSALYADRGIDYMKFNEYKAASWDFTEAIKLDTSNSEALYNASFLNMKIRKNTNALELFYRYKKSVLLNKLKFFENTSSFEKFLVQLQALDSAITANGRTADLLFKRASIYVKGMEFKLATEDITGSIHLDPNKSEYYALRAFANYKLENRKEALDDLTKAESLSGNRNSPLSRMIRGNK
jgi:Tfp pilus assembly protein PilF